MKATIDHAGRIVIPKPIRELARLRPGSPLDVVYRDGRIEIELKVPSTRLVRKGSVLVLTAPRGQKMSLQEVNEWVRKSRDREI
jgi:AbrB family looped-hinge helix DNA binding protein